MGRQTRRASWAMVVLVGCVLMSARPAAADAQQAASELSEVTLYRNQAQITRGVAVPKGQGPVELVVTELPPQIQPDTLFAEGGEAIDVRAVRYRERVVSEEPREEIRALDEQILGVQLRLDEIAAMKGLVDKRFAYLDKLENFAAKTGTEELSRGVLDAKQLRETTEFVFDQRESATKRLLELQANERETKKELALLQKERNQLAGKSQVVVREAVLFLDRRDAQADGVRLTYLVNNCGWSPSYNVRGDLDGNTVRVEYNALIRQLTGEDWDQVKLTLSTASPMISASGPAIAGFPVSLKQLSRGGRAVNGFDLNDALSNTSPGGQNKLGQAYFELQQQQSDNTLRFNRNSDFSSNASLNWSNNLLANDRQLIELCEPIDKLAPMLFKPTPAQGLSISYTIEGRVSLQSRADQQMTRIMQSEHDADFYHVANPVLTQFVYREAEVENTSGRDLLEGPVNVYLDGRFVGRTDMVSVTRGQTFVLGFGADPQVTATRQLVQREQQQQGGNTLLSFEYRLSVENFGNKPAEVRLFDRLPNFENGDDVKLTLVSGFDGLSEDPVYLRIDRPKGILRWDITADAGATGEDAAVVPYHYTLEFDRNYGLSSEVAPADEQEFKLDLQERRKR